MKNDGYLEYDTFPLVFLFLSHVFLFAAAGLDLNVYNKAKAQIE